MVGEERRRLRVTGVVQGVGFRPFVYALARRHELSGFVTNDSAGVIIEVEGQPHSLDSFEQCLLAQPPPLAHIEGLSKQSVPATGQVGFEIHVSEAIPEHSTPISPDIATCDACLRELLDPQDRRYRYPFLNCTDCGPRFTITRDIPYDRPFTTMAAFAMCADCSHEYHNPADRRFHAQPTACPVCGPHLIFYPGGQTGEAALLAAQRELAGGKIIAVKGIGGFHLACDATSNAALAELRRRKGRVDKPFALMASPLDQVKSHAWVSPEEERLLVSRERPIVLLRRKDSSSLSQLVAPGNNHLGFFLPYSPLHHLLLGLVPLVMTSGNRSDEPIARDNQEALERLADLADGFLLHNRDIHVVCDDSVVRVFRGHELPIRRSRGYAPLPVKLTKPGPSILAVGGELKATLCVTREDHAYMSQHIGDMENVETLQAFERAFRHLSALFRIQPKRIICDMHPGYLSTQWAMETARAGNLPCLQVQHHHAHIASLMAEHALDGSEPVIGVSFDGTGFGTDGAIWGGELLLADYRSFHRLGHLKYVPLPGGDASVKRPYRMALAHLQAAGIPWTEELPCVRAVAPTERALLQRQIATGLNCVDTSSMGRLFDAVGSLIGIRHTVTYEAQAAMELEALADPACTEEYRFDVLDGDELVFDPSPLWHAMIGDLIQGTEKARISARFHRGVALLIVDLCKRARQSTGAQKVALSGGVFQNLLLLEWSVAALEDAGFEVLTHRLVPPNDGGLALGQAVIGLELP